MAKDDAPNTSGRKRTGSDPTPGTSTDAKKSKLSTDIITSIPAKIVSRITPDKSPRDPNDYRVIKLSNGLTIALISRKDTANGLLASSNCPASHTEAKWPSFMDTSSPQGYFIQPELEPLLTFNLACKSDDVIHPIDDWSTILHRTCPAPPDSTSVAVVVNIGGFNDPFNCQGLAHFTEHMVHYGSKKYPEEDAVSSVVMNFGCFNATTRPHTTNYYNEVPNAILERNLELFANMLAQPLFSEEVLNREVHAVDNEFYLRLPACRKTLLQSHVLIEDKQHPLGRFMCGSLETLSGSAAVQKVMQECHQKNYVASAMTMSINSTAPLDLLEELAIQYFSEFQHGDRATFTQTLADPSPNELIFHENQQVYLQGLSNKPELSLLWHLPASIGLKNIHQRSLPLIIRMLSDTGPGSLDHYLRSQQLIWSLDAESTAYRYATVLEIVFHLTELGTRDVDRIVLATFSYLRFIQNPALEEKMLSLFNEMRILQLKYFHYGNQKTSLETTKDLAMRLQYINEPAEVLTKESWQDSKFNFISVQEALTMLNAKNLLIVETLGKSVPLENKGQVQIAPYTGARYVVVTRSLDEASLQNDLDSDSGPVFNFIPINSYLSLDVQPINTRCNCPGRSSSANPVGSGDASGYVLRCPDNCGDIEAQRLNWRSLRDIPHDYALPRIMGQHHGHTTNSLDPFFSMVRIQFLSPMALCSNPLNHAFIWLWVHCIIQNAAPLWSGFTYGGFSVDIHPTNMGMSIVVSGFPRHLDQVVNTLVSYTLEQPISPTVFYLAKQQFTSLWEAYLSHGDIVISHILKSSMFQQADLSPLDFAGSLAEMDLNQLNMYIKGFKTSTFAYVELMGNVPLSMFESLANHLEVMPFAPLLDNNAALYNQKYLPVEADLYTPGECCVRVRNVISSALTTTVTNMYVLGPYGTDQQQTDLFSVAMRFMNWQAFMDLRTKQQLGYSVHMRKLLFRNTKVPLMMFYVSITATANKFSACELNDKIDRFLVDYGKQLSEMKPELYETMLELTCTPASVTQADVARWFQAKFTEEFGQGDLQARNWRCVLSGIKKLSIQVLSGSENAKIKTCACEICSTVGEQDWQPGNCHRSQFLYAKGSGITKDYFKISPKF